MLEALNLHIVLNYIVELVASWGYAGIFVMMAIESSFLPLPSEVVMIPAGYLIYKGEMAFFPAFMAGVLGSVAGALVNYYLALWVGKPFLHRYGKYLLISEASLTKTEEFFREHGSFSTFTGRLIPVVRHLISLPAGLARMNMTKFIFYTATGAAIWVAILLLVGYFIGHNQDLIHIYMDKIILATLALIAVSTVAYIYVRKKINKKRAAKLN